MKSYFKLLHFIKGHEGLFAFAIAMMFVSSLFEGFQLSLAIPMVDRIFTDKEIVAPDSLPQFVHNLIDWLNETDKWKLFWGFPFVFVTMMTLKHLFIYIHKIAMSSVSERVVRDVRFRLYERIQNLSLDFFSKKRTGELISRITNDVLVIENAVSYATTDLFKQTFLLMIYLTVSVSIYPKGALIIFLMFPFIGLPIIQIGKKLRKISKSFQEKLADITAHLIETISGASLVKAENTEKYEIEKFRESNQNLYKLRMSEIKRVILISPITEVVGTLVAAIIFILIGMPVMKGEMSFGVFVLFFGSMLQVISPAKKLGNVNAIVQQALAANKRIYDVLEKEETVKEKENAKDIGDILEGMRIDCKEFKYGEDSETVLKDIELDIKKGELVAIVGPTGTGKSTLVNLIPRFYDPTVGSVSIDGIDLKDVTFKSLRDKIAIVSQETILFNDTVKNNISYGRFEATQEQIENAAKNAFADFFIEKMPQSYDTVIGDRGFRLSGGERQRLAIARAILKDAPILILDEATSALDSESERYIQEALDKLMVGRTVVAIAHRLSTIQKADKIVVLDKGQIVGSGKHTELLETCALYKKLHSMQFEA